MPDFFGTGEGEAKDPLSSVQVRYMHALQPCKITHTLPTSSLPSPTRLLLHVRASHAQVATVGGVGRVGGVELVGGGVG